MWSRRAKTEKYNVERKCTKESTNLCEQETKHVVEAKKRSKYNIKHMRKRKNKKQRKYGQRQNLRGGAEDNIPLALVKPKPKKWLESEKIKGSIVGSNRRQQKAIRNSNENKREHMKAQGRQ